MAIRQLPKLNYALFSSKINSPVKLFYLSNVREQLSQIFASYQRQTGVLIPILQKGQEVLGYFPEEAVSEIAVLPPIKVRASRRRK